MILTEKELNLCISGQLGDPHELLGLHPLGTSKGVVARAIDPSADELLIINHENGNQTLLNKIHPDGFFEGVIKDTTRIFAYSFKSVRGVQELEWVDPFSFQPSIHKERLFKFSAGSDRRPFEKLGSFPCFQNGVEGVSFVLWAPSAKSVHLVGDFNEWRFNSLPMRSLGNSGCREIFVPGAKVGQKYKYRVLGFDNVLREKTDPFGLRFEPPPGNASFIENRDFSISEVEKRDYKNPRTLPISIYEMHLGSWKHKSGELRSLSYLELADELPKYLKEMGFTHVEFLPLSEYPYGPSWGYQVTGFYAPTHRYGTPEEFQVLVNALKEEGIGVIIDWVPAHFPSDEFALGRFDGTCLFEHEDPRQGKHAEWDTLIFNYGRSEVRSFLIGSAISWLDRFGVDGFRVDAVASMLYLDYGRSQGQWIPNKLGGKENLEAIQFIKEFNQAVHEEYPDTVTIAEESTAFPKITQSPSNNGLGFDFKWNMGWMHDVLTYFQSGSTSRSEIHDKLTFGATYQDSENFIQAFSHDEVVHGKGSLANKMGMRNENDRLINLRALLAFQWTWPGKKTLFMGGEIGQWKEWDYDNQLDWELLNFPLHSGLQQMVADLNHLYKNHHAWSKYDHQRDKFRWIDCNDKDGQTLSYLRFGERPEETILVACNFSDQLRHRDWGCPHSGEWRVIFDSDSPQYGGEGAAGATDFYTQPHHKDSFDNALSFSVSRWSVRILILKS